MVTTLLLALIMGGLAGLIAPTDPATLWGRLGLWVQRAAALGILVGFVLAFLLRAELAAELSRMN